MTNTKKCRPSANIHLNEDVYKLIDANGYSCGYVCDACHDEIKAKFKAEIFESSYDDTFNNDGV